MPGPADRGLSRDDYGVVALLTRSWPIATAGLVAATAILWAAGWPASTYRRSDFSHFYTGGRALLEGADPYDVQWWRDYQLREGGPAAFLSPQPEGAPRGSTPYPLWTFLLAAPFSAMPFGIAAPAWLVAQLAVVVAALLAFGRVLGCERREMVLLFGLAAGFQPIWLIAGGGNLTGYLLGAFVAATVGTLGGRSRIGGVGLGLLVLKPHLFGIAVPALLIAARAVARRSVLAAAIATVGSLTVVTVPFGWSWMAKWLSAAGELQSATGSNATVWTIGRALPSAPGLSVVLAVASVLALSWWGLAARPSRASFLAGAVAISLFVAPRAWSYDHVLLLVPLAAAIQAAATLTEGRRRVALIATTLIAIVLPWTLYGLAFEQGDERWSAITPIAFFLLLVMVRSRLVRGGSSATAPAS